MVATSRPQGNQHQTDLATCDGGTGGRCRNADQSLWIEIHRWLLQSLTIPRPEIVEWHALRPGDEPFMAFALLVVATLVGLIFSRRPLDATHTVVLLLLLWQALFISGMYRSSPSPAVSG